MISMHAEQRMQQRGISSAAIALVTDYGRVDHHRGAEIYYLDRHAVQAIEKAKVCTKQQLEKLQRTYVVWADEHLITVGHKTGHFKRDRASH